ncbi:uncharacterized protein LOC143284710 [Babylonia areolata]|uniref:uncharacterized protein LOC143284710 n=1 Tax=Babylonia areolata TaxID=304850 RepID=UPI003FD42531
MAEMNGPHVQPGSQPASGGTNSGAMTGGFEMVSSGMGIGGGAGVSPPVSNVGGLSMTDITLEQALARMQDLMRENAELREYLKENNEMMKKQFETLSQWKQKVHDANVLNRDKFEQTRALITALRSENEELLVKIRENNDKEDSLCNKIKTMETELNTLKTAKAASDQLAYNVVKQAEQQGVDVGEEETQMRETVYVASADKEEAIMSLEEKVSQLTVELEQAKERSRNLEHDNVQFRSSAEHLLKDLESTQQLKQQMQRENQDLRRETVELQQQLQALLAETKNSLQRTQTNPFAALQHLAQARDSGAENTKMPISGNNSQDGSMGRTPNATIDDWQETSAVVTAEVEQLRKQLEEGKQKEEKLQADLAAKELEISQLQGQIHLQTSELTHLQAQHEERVRQLQHEHESSMEQMERQKTAESSVQQQGLTATHAEDVQTLRSQVLTLINEVHETQNKLAAAQRAIETKNTRVKELETYSTQVVSESQHRMQQLQQALSLRENQLAEEQKDHGTTKNQMSQLRRSFNQLVSDYKEVLDTFEQFKSEQEQRMRSSSQQQQQMDTINHLTAQVVAAEEAISMREDRIKRLQQDLREKEETMDVLRAQAEVYKADFEAEREARSRLAMEKERVSAELEGEQLKAQGLADQLTRYTQQQLHDMQLRATQGSSPSPSHLLHYPHHHHLAAGAGGRGGGGGGAFFQRMGGGGNANVTGGGFSPPTGSFNNLSLAPEGIGQRTTPPGGGGGGGGGNQAYGGRLNAFTQGQNLPAGGPGYGGGAGGGQYPVGGGGGGARGQYHGEAGVGGDPRMPFPQNLVMQPPGSQGSYMEAHAFPMQAQGGGRGGGGGAPQARGGEAEEEEQTLYICPSCNQRLPDYDTLTIHVQDCLEQNAQEAP